MKTGIGLIFSFLLLSAKPIEKEQPYFVEMKNTNFESFSTQKVTISSEAVFYNTYSVGAKLLEVNIDVYINDTKIGTVIEMEDIKIPKNSSFDVPLELGVKPGPALVKVVTSGATMLFGRKITARYVGYIKIRALGMVPIRINMDETESYGWDDIFPPETKTTPK